MFVSLSLVACSLPRFPELALTSLAPAISPDPVPTALGTREPEVTGHFLNPFCSSSLAAVSALNCISLSVRFPTQKKKKKMAFKK